MKKVFIDGSAGTTGLRIRERLLRRADIELLTLPEKLRKDAAAARGTECGGYRVFVSAGRSSG